MKEAAFCHKQGDRLKCELCPHGCVIAEGKVGICRVRKNIEGKLYSLIYGRVSSMAMDPVEKKPLYHFYPGREILSLGTLGCNFACPFCQNWQISQQDVPTENVSPASAVELARRHGSIGLAYTYNEPFIWYEYVFDTAKLIRQAGMVNVLVTNGYVNEEPLRQILPYIDAMNIDLKGIRQEFYQKLCRGKLAPVQRTIELSVGSCHIELTNLIIPGQNDSEDDISQLVDWVASISPSIPVHFSRYFPQYKMDEPPTPRQTLLRAREIALKKLKFVYLGNMPDSDYDSTFCPGCGTRVITRIGYNILDMKVKNSQCTLCNTPVPVVGS